MTKVKKTFFPQSNSDLKLSSQIRDFNLEVTRTFGKHGVRWKHTVEQNNGMVFAKTLLYEFVDPQDATMFVLKFGGTYNG